MFVLIWILFFFCCWIRIWQWQFKGRIFSKKNFDKFILFAVNTSMEWGAVVFQNEIDCMSKNSFDLAVALLRPMPGFFHEQGGIFWLQKLNFYGKYLECCWLFYTQSFIFLRTYQVIKLYAKYHSINMVNQNVVIFDAAYSILSNETAATIIHALITSRIDNGNSLLTGVTDHSLRKLQLAQNAAARILTKTRKFDHITPILKDLHWLPVRERINFKLLLLTWKVIDGLAPSYISNFLVPYKPVCALRSSDKHLLTVPRTSSTLKDCAFSVAAPTLWNSLPLDIRCCDSLQSFKTLLKTHIIRCITDTVQLCIFNCVMFYVCALLFAPRNRIF